MFSDAILEEILAKDNIQNIPCQQKSDMIRTVADVIEEKLMEGGEANAILKLF